MSVEFLDSSIDKAAKEVADWYEHQMHPAIHLPSLFKTIARDGIKIGIELYKQANEKTPTLSEEKDSK